MKMKINLDDWYKRLNIINSINHTSFIQGIISALIIIFIFKPKNLIYFGLLVIILDQIMYRIITIDYKKIRK